MKIRRVARLTMAALLMFTVTGCASSGPFVGTLNGTASLLENGPPIRYNAADAKAQINFAIPFVYLFAYEAGFVRPLDVSLDNQQEALRLITTAPQWQRVARAGESYIDLVCDQYKSALYTLDKNRRTSLAELNSIQSATTGVMGLAKAASKAIGVVGIAFGLASSLFDTTLSSVLFQLPPSSVVAVIDAQKQVYRSQEVSGNPRWDSIDNVVSVIDRMNEYISYCTPVVIEANVGRVLSGSRQDKGTITSTVGPAANPGQSGTENVALPPVILTLPQDSGGLPTGGGTATSPLPPSATQPTAPATAGRSTPIARQIPRAAGVSSTLMLDRWLWPNFDHFDADGLAFDSAGIIVRPDRDHLGRLLKWLDSNRITDPLALVLSSPTHEADRKRAIADLIDSGGGA